jgi:acyl-CoA synthetase (NDP forming)
MSGVHASLSQLFRPGSVAIIGASDSNPWSGLVAQSLKALQFKGAVHLVNKRGSPALGRSTFLSCSSIGEPVDAAFIVVPATGVMEALDDIGAADIRHGVLVTSGFAEIGEEGAAEQNRVFNRARNLGLTLLGPNSVGYANFVDGVGLGALPIRVPFTQGKVAVVSQSGAVAGQLVRFAQQQDIGLSYAVSLGNEAMLGLADVLEFLIADAATSVICVFAESIRSPREFAAVAARALAAQKPILMLKVGRGSLSAEVAKAHTGALVGDDRVLDSVCRDLGVIRVSSIELLLQTAHLLAATGVLQDKGFAIASISGGACEITADLGEEAGVRFSRFAAQTCERVAPLLPAFGHVNNPLDVTGEAMRDPTVFDKALRALGDDPDVALVACIFDLPADESDGTGLTAMMLENIGRGLNAAPCPSLLVEQCLSSRSTQGASLLRKLKIPVAIGGIDYAMQAIGLAFRWSAVARSGASPVPNQSFPEAGVRPRTERETLDYLGSRGVPVIPAVIARSRAESVAAAEKFTGPVALKIHSRDIQHKTEVGGVALDLTGARAVASAYDAIQSRVSDKAPGARIEGITVSPMRRGGIELLVGIVRDPDWGLILAVGLGGVFVEALQDTALRVLPATSDDVARTIGQTKAGQLLRGYRGEAGTDIGKLAKIIADIGEAALALGADLMSLEINPLLVSGDTIECLDALVIWKGE